MTVMLGYLILYTSETAKDIVKVYAHPPPEMGYKEARSRLHEKYNAGEAVVKAQVNNIMNHLKVKEGDLDGLEEFGIQVLLCCDILRGEMRQSKEIHLPVTYKDDISTLPYSLQEKWHA